MVEDQIGRPLETREVDNVVEVLPVDGKCPMLTPAGCCLKEKPISCTLWPFLPTKDGGWVMRMTCKYWRSITLEDFEQIKQAFESKKHLWRNFV
jgi:hypothetical protein